MNCIGWAVKQMQDGQRVRRAGWNGKGMWLSLTQGRRVPPENFWSAQNTAFAAEQPHRYAEVAPYVTIKTADDKIVPWVCSQTDLLAIDWEIAE